jgi:integral membrane protein
MVKLLRKVAFWEATFFVVLCMATVVGWTGYKISGGLYTALIVVGFTHGFVFTVYCILILVVRARMRWSILTTLSILVAGLLPGGGYIVEMRALHGARVDALAEAW